GQGHGSVSGLGGTDAGADQDPDRPPGVGAAAPARLRGNGRQPAQAAQGRAAGGGAAIQGAPSPGDRAEVAPGAAGARGAGMTPWRAYTSFPHRILRGLTITRGGGA